MMRVTERQAESTLEYVRQIFPGISDLAAARTLRVFVGEVSRFGLGEEAWESFQKRVDEALVSGEGWAYEVTLARLLTVLGRSC